MFNFGAYPEFSNVSHKTSYARNMYVSYLYLMSFNKISLVLYEYYMSTYCISLFLVNGDRPYRSMYNFPVLESTRPMVENMEFVDSFPVGVNLFPYPVLNAHLFLSVVFS